MKKKCSGYSDIQLYRMLNDNDPKSREDAFAELYARYSKGIYAYCRRILGSETLAEDIFQETFLSFLKSAEQDREMTNVQAFLLRIARNLCLNENRQKKTRIFSLDDFELGIEDNRNENSEIAKIIVSALNLLSDEQKEAVILQLYHDMTYQDMSEFLNLPVSTVRNRVTRGKQKIRLILAPYFEKKEV